MRQVIFDSFATVDLSRARLAIRVDDVGRDDAATDFLIANLLRSGLGVNLEVIPLQLCAATSKKLLAYAGRFEGLLEVHQHGYGHFNHEAGGKKQEFGSSRSYEEKFHDIFEGEKLLQARLGPLFHAIFCPPWNRMDDMTTLICRELGFKAVSAFVGVSDLPAGLKNVNANIDWGIAKRHGLAGVAAVAVAIWDNLRSARNAVLMVHPATETDANLKCLLTLLGYLKDSGVTAVTFSRLIE